MSELAEEDKSSIATEADTAIGPPEPPNLKVQKLDYYYSRWSRKWKYKKMGTHVVAEVVRAPPKKGNTEDAWAQFCFVVVRTVTQDDEGKDSSTFKVTIKSEYLANALEHVIQDFPGISWNAGPLEFNPKVLLCFLPDIEKYRRELKATIKDRSEEEKYQLQTLDVFTDYLRTDYMATIKTYEKLTTHGEVTSELLTMLFVPRTILISTCPMTGEPQALRLISTSEKTGHSGTIYELSCARLDVVDDGSGLPDSETWGEVSSVVYILPFIGVKKIRDLDAYPIDFHPDVEGLKKQLMDRGRKWASLDGIHHMAYKGTGSIKCQGKVIKYNLNSRVMIDRENFRRLVPNYVFPMPVYTPSPGRFATQPPAQAWGSESQVGEHVQPVPTPAFHMHTMVNKKKEVKRQLTDDELLLTPPNLFAFSLSDKVWLELNVEKVLSIQWNTEAFKNLVLPNNRKVLLQSLVEAHNADLGFDDFVRGKGQGLVVNLFGPPGVGKTLSAEATSEHVGRPLYVVGAGDLGTTAAELDNHLTEVFDLATAWKAIVLIDEADVFLEKRSLHTLHRNAMVAVFLRHLEYYRGILFLTTNRVQAFDDAFLSRIHIALRFHDLPFEAKCQVWTAFLRKAEVHNITDDDIKDLATHEVNGREIKNAVRTANSLAFARSEKLGYAHLKEVLEVMEHFAVEVEADA